MSGQAHDKQQYDSDNDFEKPKDDFLFYYQAFKIEEKKMCAHQKFEEITTKYWQLLKDSFDDSTTKTNIPKSYYIELMKRVYKALLPLYREEEMKTEIEEEWLADSRGQETLTFQLLTKTLFRIAHQWSTHIDLDEYIDLLEKILNRITHKKAHYHNIGYSYSVDLTGELQVKFPLLDKKVQDGAAAQQLNKSAQGIPGAPGGASRNNDDWLECRSDESNKSDYDYKYEEDPDNMVVKKYKKQKLNEALGLNGPGALSQVIKEPFYYSEEIVYQMIDNGNNGDAHFSVLRDFDRIMPFGMPAAAFLEQTKQSVMEQYESLKEQHKASKDVNKQFVFEDPLLRAENTTDLNDQYLYLKDSIDIKITDSAYNIIRKSMRDGAIMSVRMVNNFPKGNARSKSRTTLSSNEPITEINKFGYNPALERRIHLEKKDGVWSNKYYMINENSKIDIYRSDINRIETKDKMCLKENDEIKKDEEFNAVETSYKRLRQIMLFKKYESIYSDRANADNKEQKRLKKLIEKEEKRKQNSLKSGNIAQKGLSETYEEKSFIKMMKGPFYQLESKEGLREDDFVNCGEQDLIDAARTQALRVLVIGKPRSGKTTLCANLAKKLDLVHINIDNWINALVTKIREYVPPDDLEEGQEPPRYLTDLEEQVNQALLQGGGPTDDQQIEILKLMIRSPAAVLKGYLLDLSYFARDSSWASTIRQKYLLSDPDEMGQTVEFSHIIELWCEDEDVRLRCEKLRVNPDDGVLYSKWEREERVRQIKLKEEQEDEPADDDAVELKPLDEASLVQRTQDTDDKIKEELHYYNTVERPAMEELLINFYDNQYIKLDSGGLTPTELVDCASCRIKPDDDLPLRPLAIQIQDAGDYKSLLTQDLNLDEGAVPRKWSLWRQTDPVALSQGKVIQGQPENAAHYNGNVFVFATDDNLQAFIKDPKSYLINRPSMPAIFRTLMLGPKGVGKHTQAQFLSDIYGWAIVDYKDLVKNKLEELMKFEIHIPNNPQQGGRIGLSEQELSDIIEGKQMPAWKFIPWIFDYLGFPLMKRKPAPPEEKQDEDKEEEEAPQLTEAEMKKKLLEEKRKREEEERKRKEEEELQRYKEDRRRRRQEAIEAGKDPIELGIEESEEEPIIIEDLSIDQLVLKEDEETGQVPFVGGFILIGYPETEEHINKLKAHGIEFDKIIYLNDTNEEEPGTEIKKRMKDVEMYDWDWELENSQKILGLAKEHLNEEIVREISCNGSVDDVLIRIRNEIDPFFVKVDNPDDVRTSADLSGEEGEKKLPKGDFGDYCPVTYVKDNWIVRGNPEQEVTIFGKTYFLSGEQEATDFKFNPKQYLVTQWGGASLPLTPPPPRIMILGHRGAGTTSQIRMLCDKYKIDEFELKNSYLATLKEEKEKRKRRRLLDRGFRPPQPADEETGEVPPDPEIEEDPEDFEREVHERQVMKMIYDNQKGYVIDGNWRDLPEGAIAHPNLQELLFESRRVPEIVIILKCKEKATFDRCIDRQTIQNTFNKLIEAREAEKAKVRQEERAAYYQEITNVPEDEEAKSEEEINDLMAQWDEARDAKEKEDDENDPDMPNYDSMEEVEREKLREQRTNDDALFEEFAAALRDKQVIVIDDIKSDMSAEFVHVKLVDRIKDNFLNRKDIIERQLAQPLLPKEVKNFEQSYIYKHSKFGINSPITLSHPIKTKDYSVLYRERIYFLTDKDQQDKFLREPSKYAFNQETIPLDIQIKPKIFVVGMPMSGKTTTSEMLSKKLGLVHLRIHDIIDYFIEKDSHIYHNLRKQMKLEGRQIEDDMIINLILKRIQYKDCQTKGWVLDDFPKTRNQAMFMAKKGLVPTNVFAMRVLPSEAFTRSYANINTHFGCFKEIIKSRIQTYYQNNPGAVAFYQKYYNNVVEIDGTRSKWFIEERIISEISKSLNAKQQFAKDYNLKEREQRPCKVRDMHIDRCLMKQTLSEFKYYCPVTWKNEKLLVKCSANKEDCVLLKNAFYYFRSTKERDLFLANPSRFIVNVTLPKDKDMPMRAPHHKAAEILLNEKHLNTHCAVTLIDEERVKKGDPLLLILFKEGKYVFDNEFKLQRFLVNPYKYARATLPVKMPPPEEKISLFNLQKMEDSIAFMEQSLGQVVTRGLREVSENRLKHPGMSVKETMLKLFALFLKTENPANTTYTKKKYQNKMKQFIQRCELPEELFDLGTEKQTLKNKGQWPEYKENYYNHRGEIYDNNKAQIETEKQDNFIQYMR